jgi:NTE family protein
MAADLYDQLLFEKKTYRDMLEPGRPVVMINATDVARGAQFSFYQPQFTLLCSNLLDFPVSRAVTASSAVPIVFNSVVLRNNTGECTYELPQFLIDAHKDRDTRSRRFHQADLKLAYLNREERPFVHLQDGGLSDNLGVRALMDAFFLRGGAVGALKEAGFRQTNRIVVVVVNAESAKDLSSAKKDTSIPLFDSIGAATSVPLNHYSFETMELLHQQAKLWEEDLIAARCEYFLETKKIGAVNKLETACTDVETYVIEVSFKSIRDHEERKSLENLPTSFRLEDDQVDELKAAAKRLLRKSKEYQRFLGQLP